MNTIRLMNALRRRWLTVLIILLLTVSTAVTASLLMTPMFTATTKLLFSAQSANSNTDLAQGSSYTEKQMESYADVAGSPLVLNRVIRELDLPQTAEVLAESVTASVELNTVILLISVESDKASESARIANSIGKETAAIAVSLAPARADGSKPVLATTLAKAQVPSSASSPRVFRNVAFSVFLGLILGLAIAIARDFLDTRVRSDTDVSNVSEYPLLGQIPFDAQTPEHPVVMHDVSQSGRSESIRRLRTNLQFVQVAEGSTSMVITSSIPGEGKTTTALNLAVSLADAGLKVIIIDADLRRPTIGQYLGLESSVGLTTVLIGKATLQDVLQSWGESSLDVLPAGQIPPNPSELLGSKAMSALLTELAQTYDQIIFDSPPLLPVTDAAVLSKITGGTLVVVGADQLHRAQLRKAIDSLDTVGANVLGIVVNKFAKRSQDVYGYGYGYGGGYEYPQKADTQTIEDGSEHDLSRIARESMLALGDTTKGSFNDEVRRTRSLDKQDVPS